MKAFFVLGLTLLVLVSALSTGWETMYRLSYTMAAVLVLSYLWTWGNVRWVRCRHEIKTPRTQVGGQIEERLALENTSWLPKLWLEIRDDSTLVGRRGHRVLSLGWRERRSFSLVTRCDRRGEFTLGPFTLCSGDPFGLFRMRRGLKGGGTVIVYPAIAPLVSFGRFPGELPGGSVRGERAYVITPNAAGVRDYCPGDALNRIHWLSSARLRRLVVKEFDLDPLSEVWLVLDLDRAVQVGAWPDSTEEWAVSIAATLANYFLSQQREVGIITQGRTLVADRGERQLHKALGLLAVAQSTSAVPLEQLVASEEVRFKRGSAAVIVTPSGDKRCIAALRLLQARGVGVAVVLLDASSFGAGWASLPMVGWLAACGVPAYLVRLGDNLSQALARPVGGQQAIGHG